MTPTDTTYRSNRGLRGRATCSEEGCEKIVHGRGLCSKHYERARKQDLLPQLAPPPSSCALDGCNEPRAEGRTICVMHRERLRKRGAVGSPSRLRRRAGSAYLTPDGYAIRTLSTHPLARVQGKLLEHRRVLYDAIGPGPHPCHWCARPVDWQHGLLDPGALVVDHLDFDRSNNAIENLVPSCHPCNSTRKPA